MPLRRPQKRSHPPDHPGGAKPFKLKTDDMSSKHPSNVCPPSQYTSPFDTTMERLEPYICRTQVTLEPCMGQEVGNNADQDPLR